MLAAKTPLSFREMKQLTSHLPPCEDPMISALTTQEGWELLKKYPHPCQLEAPIIAKQLRKRYPAALVASLQTQWVLREKAQIKLGDEAKNKLFTREGLEQASRQIVSIQRAKRFTNAGIDTLIDVGCGIGADSMQLAASCQQLRAIDISPTAATCAAINLSEIASARVYCESAQQVTTQNPLPALFFDPARRLTTGRALSPDSWSPPLSKVLAWGGRASHLAVKMAPGIDLSYLPDNSHAQWVSVDGDLVECALYSLNLAPEGAGRSALIIQGTQVKEYFCASASRPGENHVQVPPASSLGDYLFDPNPAIIRAGIIPDLCEKILAAPISNGIAYLSGNSMPLPEDSLAITCYRIIEDLPLKTKTVSSYLRTIQATRLDVLKRGVVLDIASWRKKVMPKKTRGFSPRTVTVALTRVGAGHRCLVLEPCK